MSAFRAGALALALACAAGAPALAQAPQASPEPTRVGGAIKAPAKLKGSPPEYPDKARRARIQGIVILDCTINAEGVVTDVKVLRSIPDLDEAAIKAVKEWRYSPTQVDGKPVPVRMSVSINFTIR